MDIGEGSNDRKDCSYTVDIDEGEHYLYKLRRLNYQKLSGGEATEEGQVTTPFLQHTVQRIGFRRIRRGCHDHCQLVNPVRLAARQVPADEGRLCRVSRLRESTTRIFCMPKTALASNLQWVYVSVLSLSLRIQLTLSPSLLPGLFRAGGPSEGRNSSRIV